MVAPLPLFTLDLMQTKLKPKRRQATEFEPSRRIFMSGLSEAWGQRDDRQHKFWQIS